jgi:hypothetical protein
MRMKFRTDGVDQPPPLGFDEEMRWRLLPNLGEAMDWQRVHEDKHPQGL